MLWNEPNNLSHWDFQMDPEWCIFSAMVKQAARAVRSENSRVVRALGGISPIDPNFMQRLDRQGALEEVEVVAVHGFPLDCNHSTIHESPAKIEEIEAVTRLPTSVSEASA